MVQDSPAPFVIFGDCPVAGALAAMLRACGHDVVACRADGGQELGDGLADGVRVVDMTGVREAAPPDAWSAVVVNTRDAPRGVQANLARARLFRQVAGMGYALPGWCHPTAQIGRTASLGRNVIVLEHGTIESEVVVLDNVIVDAGAMITQSVLVRAHGHIGLGAVVAGRCCCGEAVYLAENATLRSGIRVHDRSVLNAGAVLLSDMDPDHEANAPPPLVKQ